MTADFEKLGKRAVSCTHWRWMPGMLARGRNKKRRIEQVTDGEPFPYFDGPPDLTDPATVGCLLALVRQAWANPRLHAVTDNEGSFVDPADGPHWRVFATNHCFEGNTEAEALVAALEGAP